jgi:hypothetical protein
VIDCVNGAFEKLVYTLIGIPKSEMDKREAKYQKKKIGKERKAA